MQTGREDNHRRKWVAINPAREIFAGSIHLTLTLALENDLSAIPVAPPSPENLQLYDSKVRAWVRRGMDTTRIFVGGLGEKVTEEDLHNTFSSLGTIAGVELVRTNGRTFAYFDFHPSSIKSLSKLFSSYNGCVWKGGRLRLEKAKEHYLVRLRREWEEDAEVSHETKDDLVEDEKKDLSKKSKALTLEKKQLHIFFPRLRKVKSVPYSGTGKHKYSFQRVEVPSLPIHFCDCEEHSGSSEIAKVKQISDIKEQDGNVNEEELHMMRSVMNKIFKREDELCAERGNTLPFDGVSPKRCSDDVPPIERDGDDVPFSEAEADQDSDIDNLVINIVNRGHTKSGLVENGSLENDIQESYFEKGQDTNDGSAQNMFKSHNKRTIDPFDISERVFKKPRLIPSDGKNKNEFSSAMRKKEGSPGINRKELEGLLESQPDQKRSSQQLAAAPRRQKSSWKELVGATANSSFSISHILPADRVTQILSKPNFDPSTTIDRKRQKLRKQVVHIATNSECKGLVQDEVLEEKVCADGPSDEAQRMLEQPRGKSSDFEPVEEDEGILDKVSTDGHSIVAQIGSPSKELKNPEDVQSTYKKGGDIQTTDEKGSNCETRGNNSWLHKSSWRELVAEMDSGSFSMSQILPNVASSEERPTSNNTTVVANPFDKKPQNSSKQLTNEGVGKSGVVHGKIPSLSSNIESIAKEKESLVGLEAATCTLEMKSEPDVSKVSDGKNVSPSDKRRSIDTGIGEVCTFMRSSQSEKELMKLRAALSGKHKKKNIEK